jgi:hypothetical protein
MQRTFNADGKIRVKHARAVKLALANQQMASMVA